MVLDWHSRSGWNNKVSFQLQCALEVLCSQKSTNGFGATSQRAVLTIHGTRVARMQLKGRTALNGLNRAKSDKTDVQSPAM